MKIKELIEELSGVNPDMPVEMVIDGERFQIGRVDWDVAVKAKVPIITGALLIEDAD